MFQGIAIHSSSVRRQYTHALAVDSGMLLLTRATDCYPGPNELTRLCALSAPDVILLDIDNPEAALACLESLQRTYPDVPVICFGGTPVQHKTFRPRGVNHFLAYPPEPHIFIATLAQAIRGSYEGPLPGLCAFVPAKAGSGSSTLAAGVAAAIAGSLGKRVLCADADLRCGPLALMLGVHPRGSLQGALSAAYELDQFKWANCVTPLHGVDFLLSTGTLPNPFPEWSHYFALLRFVESRYDVLLFDLPELVNDSTEEVIRRASSVVVVATQETVSLTLAERRIAELQKWGAPDDRIHLLVNRWTGRDTEAAEAASLAAWQIRWKIPNDYQRARAIQAGELPVPPSSSLGKALLQLAQDLLGGEAAVEAPGVRGAGLAGVFRSLVSRHQLQ